jgi:hypothetical protein
MKPSLVAFVFTTIAATVFAQGATGTGTPQTSGGSASATGTITLYGCVTGGGSTPFTMMNPATAPVQPGSVGAASSAAVIPSGGSVSLSASSKNPGGYRLTGTDMSAWSGRRVQIIGTVAPATPGAATTTTGGNNAPRLQEFRVQKVAPATGACPQP